MAETSSQTGGLLMPEEERAPASALRQEEIQVQSAAAASAPEFDHRGIQLPARSRVGGIITPQ
jgi:hypothetical protein